MLASAPRGSRAGRARAPWGRLERLDGPPRQRRMVPGGAGPPFLAVVFADRHGRRAQLVALSRRRTLGAARIPASSPSGAAITDRLRAPCARHGGRQGHDPRRRITARRCSFPSLRSPGAASVRRRRYADDRRFGAPSSVNLLMAHAEGPTGDIIHHAALALISSSLFTEPHTPASAHETWTRARIAQNGRARFFSPPADAGFLAQQKSPRPPVLHLRSGPSGSRHPVPVRTVTRRRGIGSLIN